MPKIISCSHVVTFKCINASTLIFYNLSMVIYVCMYVHTFICYIQFQLFRFPFSRILIEISSHSWLGAMSSSDRKCNSNRYLGNLKCLLERTCAHESRHVSSCQQLILLFSVDSQFTYSVCITKVLSDHNYIKLVHTYIHTCMK